MHKLSEKKRSAEFQHELSLIYRFFCWCSGARLYLLKQCPTEYNKYYGIGVIVLLTGAMASLSGGYAIYTVFQRMDIAIAFAAFWGFLIFSIDWYIVSSLRKHQQKYKELAMAFPRFILAILIAFVVSMPLKMKLFEREIEQQILFDQKQSNLEYQQLVDDEFSEISKLEDENLRLRSELSLKEDQRSKLFTMIIEEAEGKSPVGLVGKGPVYREKKAEYDKVDKELSMLRIQNVNLIQQNSEIISKLKERRDAQIQNAEVVSSQTNGFLARLQAMNRLSSRSAGVELASWFILMLFITIECSPIIVKLLSGRGPYDELLEAEEYKKQVEIRRDIIQAELTEDNQIDLHRLLEKERNDKLYKVEKLHIENEAQVVSEINTLKINKWKEEEIERLNLSGIDFEVGVEQPKGEDNGESVFDTEDSPALKDIHDFEGVDDVSVNDDVVSAASVAEGDNAEGVDRLISPN